VIAWWFIIPLRADGHLAEHLSRCAFAAVACYFATVGIHQHPALLFGIEPQRGVNDREADGELSGVGLRHARTNEL